MSHVSGERKQNKRSDATRLNTKRANLYNQKKKKGGGWREEGSPPPPIPPTTAFFFF